MEVIIIAAMTMNSVIGANGTIPWSIPEDLAHFRQVPLGHAVVMGRKTYASIGRPLDGRRNIVVTSNAAYEAPGCLTVNSLTAALAAAAGSSRVFLIGGERIYREGLPLADTLILTCIRQVLPGTAFFPSFSEKDFPLELSRDLATTSPCSVQVYRRRPFPPP
jgi:dihydrofolate reductase